MEGYSLSYVRASIEGKCHRSTQEAARRREDFQPSWDWVPFSTPTTSSLVAEALCVVYDERLALKGKKHGI